jgi:hypothetical protein
MKYSKAIKLNIKIKKLQLASYNQVIDIVPKDLYPKYETLYQKYKDNKLKSNTTVYLTPLSSFPSYKLKNYIEENKLNIETARKTEKLDTLIINDAFIKEAYFSEILKEKVEKYYTIPYNVIAENFSSFIDKNNEYNNILKISLHRLSKKDKKEGNLKPSSFIISEKNLSDAINYNNVFSILLNYPTTTGELLTKSHGNKSACDHLEFFYKMFDLIEKNNLDVVFDDNINSETNKDIVIDLEVFQTLYGMLASKDKSNWNIAREIIANCDFESSKPYVLFLVNIFNFLKNKGDNKNYHLIYKQLRTVNNKHFSFLLDKYIGYEKFIQQTITYFPEYKQIMCDCLITHLNHLFKISIIKSIHSL